MPTYEYICDNCGKQFDAFQSIKAEPLKKCPQCGKNTLRRLISGGAGLIFKGSGFYITDYKHQNGENYKPLSRKTKETKDTKSEKTISEKKPAAKPSPDKPDTKNK
jgi:putative FmdB family regulatory protein